MFYAILGTMDYYIAVDIGGTQLRAACYPPDSLKPVTLARLPTQDPDRAPTASIPLERLKDLIASILPDGPVTTISVAAPGPVDPFRGVLREAPNIPGWVDIPLQSILEERFGVPVVIGNDANLAALGEWKYGAGQGHHHMIYLTISTGIGGGIIIDDRLLLGAHGLAGELGHITIVPDGPLCGCGGRGHLEALASGTAIARWVQAQLASGASSSVASIPSLTSRHVYEAARQGDALCVAALARAGTFIGQALADFILIFNPSIVVFGGGVSRSGEFLFAPLRKALEKSVLSPHYLDDLILTTAAFGDDVGLVGALALGRTMHPPAPELAVS